MLSDSQYRALLDMYNECTDDFWLISQETRDKFFTRLFS
jgi:hypothetical protein